MDRGCRIDALLMDYNERVIREGFMRGICVFDLGEGFGWIGCDGDVMGGLRCTGNSGDREEILGGLDVMDR